MDSEENRFERLRERAAKQGLGLEKTADGKAYVLSEAWDDLTTIVPSAIPGHARCTLDMVEKYLDDHPPEPARQR